MSRRLNYMTLAKGESSTNLPPGMTQNPDRKWWQDAVFYQIYPLSFADSNDDGFGDLEGIISKLDYLSETLGVDAIWLSPFFKSPMADWGYDVSDHTDVDPIFGDLATAKRLFEEIHKRDMKVIVDYLMNHTSLEHHLVHRVEVVTGRPQAGLVCVARPEARWFRAQQLGERVQRAGLDPRPRNRPVLPAYVPGSSARLELEEP